MSRMTRSNWEAYAIIRAVSGKEKAEEYRHKRNLKNREYCPGHQPHEDEWIGVQADDDSYVLKRFFPFHFSEEDKQLFADENWRYVNSLYDCTGLPFTRDIQFHEIPTGTWVYHFISIDI